MLRNGQDESNKGFGPFRVLHHQLSQEMDSFYVTLRTEDNHSSYLHV